VAVVVVEGFRLVSPRRELVELAAAAMAQTQPRQAFREQITQAVEAAAAGIIAGGLPVEQAVAALLS
jgi:hypothetical protein